MDASKNISQEEQWTDIREERLTDTQALYEYEVMPMKLWGMGYDGGRGGLE